MKNGISPMLLTVAHRGFRGKLHMNFAREGVEAGNGFCRLISCDFDPTLWVSLNYPSFFAHVEQS